jgi:hypothetical protein
MDSYLLEQVSALCRGKRGHELLFCYGEDAFETDDKKIADQVWQAQDAAGIAPRWAVAVAAILAA